MDSDDHRRGPTCYRHDAMVERMAAVEAKVAELQQAAQHVHAIEQWQREHMTQSRWFYENEASIKQLVAASRWAVMTRSVAAWLIGIVVSVVATLGWLRENIGHFIK